MRRLSSTLAVAALVPAALVLASAPAPAQLGAAGPPPGTAGPAAAHATRAPVATGSVPPIVRRIAVRSTAAAGRAGNTVALSRVVPAGGYAAVGAVWDRGGAVPGQRLELRTRTDGRWTAWEPLLSDAEHAPEPGTAEARGARPGTDPYVVGDVDDVQLRASASASGARAPGGLTLVVVDPGDDASRASAARAGPAYPATGRGGAVTRRPGIYSRAQWGADESLRRGFSGYGEVTGSFVHHTVNANDYSAAEVPSILRAIYAYHVQGRGWSDIGYNFLVDRFGRVWEGRWGGIGRPVIGAHTLGYNEEAFAVSAIGNFESVRPSRAMLAAYARVLAWKLSLHGVEPGARVRIDGDGFAAINGHRDAASTACPGRYLYARLASIRTAAADIQHSWSSRGLRRSVTGDRRPDLLVRDGERVRLLAGDAGAGSASAGAVPPGRGGAGVHLAGRVPGRWAAYSELRIVGDWDGDGRRDLMGRRLDRLWLFPGLGAGRFGPGVGGWAGWGGRRMLTPVGDWDGDGRPDLVARVPGGAVWLFPGQGARGTRSGYPIRSSVGDADRMLGVGRWDGDGAPDLITRNRDGSLWLWPGNGPGGLLDPHQVATRTDRYDLLLGMGDLDRDGHPDLVGRDRSGGQLYLLPGTADGLGRRVAIGSGALAGDQLG